MPKSCWLPLCMPFGSKGWLMCSVHPCRRMSPHYPCALCSLSKLAGCNARLRHPLHLCREWVDERRLVAQAAIYSGTKAEGLYLGSHAGNAPSHHWFLAKTEQGEEVMSSNAFEKHAGVGFALVDISKGSATVLPLCRGRACSNKSCMFLSL